MNKKLVWLLTLLLIAAGTFAEAQPQKVWKLGIFTSSSSPVTALRLEGLRQGLGELGYVEGQNIIIEHRNAGAKPDRYPEIAAELVRLKADVIVVTGELPVLALKQTTQTIPIVMLSIGADPVEAGFVESLARPGGNITGFTNVGQELGGKRLELFKEVVPRVARIAVLYEPTNPSNVLEVKGVQTAAAALKLTMRRLPSTKAVETLEKLERRNGSQADNQRPMQYAIKCRITSGCRGPWLAPVPSVTAIWESWSANGRLSCRCRRSMDDA